MAAEREPDRVTISRGRVFNIAEFESTRIEVGLSTSVPEGVSRTEHYRKSASWVEAQLELKSREVLRKENARIPR
jgi:hypothetical protein